MKKKNDSLNTESVSLVPAAYFKTSQTQKSENAVPIPAEITEPTVITPSEKTADKEEKTTIQEAVAHKEEPIIELKEKDPVEATKELLIRERSKRVSGLSLSSLKAKKAHEQQKKEKQQTTEVLPSEPFTEEDLQTHWNAFIKKLENNGKKILASSLSTDVPKVLEGHLVWIELPNHTMKKEIEREQSGLINYLRKALQNFDISLKITVNEEVAKQYAYTPEEKYEKLREKNPAIDLLKNQFDLEL